MTIIDRLKQNKEAFGLMAPELRTVAEKIPLKWLRHWKRGTWCKMAGGIDLDDTYKLSSDYECQHPENTAALAPDWLPGKCRWCGAEIPAEKKAGWVECEIRDNHSEYLFDHNGKIEVPLKWAPGMPGFGGIKYEAPCECYGGGTTDWSYNPPDPCETHGPWKPVSVRFWKGLRNEMSAVQRETGTKPDHGALPPSYTLLDGK